MDVRAIPDAELDAPLIDELTPLVRDRHKSAEFSEVFDAAWNEFRRRYAMRLRAECKGVPDSRSPAYVPRSKRLPF